MADFLIGYLGQFRFPSSACLRSLVRVGLLFSVWFSVSKGRRCMHMSKWKWSSPLSSALQDAQQTFSAWSTNLVRIGRFRQVRSSATCSCCTSNLFLTEITTVDPHSVEQNAKCTEYAGPAKDPGNHCPGLSDSRASPPFGAHQSHAP